MRAFLVAAALLVAAPAFAQSAATSAVLTDAAKAPAGRTIIDGATWRCVGATCTASGGANQTALRACRRVVARFGTVSAFTYKGTELTAEQLTACNAA
ncbi:CC_3452 family protein [Brevundimonas sp. FT23028]|uniref:CC_3452 family protein n=1 Tax=Brevundimonas sp. FT23028 TaxID=3393748 RepID=UPI003B5897CF